MGQCARIEIDIPEIIERRSAPKPNEMLVFVSACDEHNSDAFIHTHEGFGCTLHESK